MTLETVHFRYLKNLNSHILFSILSVAKSLVVTNDVYIYFYISVNNFQGIEDFDGQFLLVGTLFTTIFWFFQ